MVTVALAIAASFLSLTVPLIAALAVTCAETLAHKNKLKLAAMRTLDTRVEKRCWQWGFMGRGSFRGVRLGRDLARKH
jgi:hypothetical protein